ATHQLHREERPVVFDEQFVETDQIDVPDVGKAPELALQSIESPGTTAMQRLQGHDFVAQPIARFVDHAHPADTEAGEDLESGGSAKTADGAVVGIRMSQPLD